MNQQQQHQHQGRPTESPEKTLGDSAQESLQAAALRPRAHVAVAATLAQDAGSLSQSASVTPSSAGDINPTPPSMVPQTTGPPMLSVRPPHEAPPLSHDLHHAATTTMHEPPPDIVVSPTLLYPEHGSMQTIQPSALFGRPEEQPPGSLQLGPAEYPITLPMDSRVKDQYIRTLRKESRAIRRLLSGSDVSADADGQDVVRAIHNLVKRLDEICVHEDLGIAEQVAESNPDPRKEATWAEYVSAKFQLFGHLLEIAAAQEQELHFLVMVKRGKAQELVERYFLGKGFTYTRPREEMSPDAELSMIKGALSVGIHPTEREGLAETYRPPRAILALDSSFQAGHPSTQHLRTTYARHGSPLPVVRLIIANTSEHAQRCLPEMPELQRLRVLMHVIISLQDVVGDLQDDALGVHEDAEELFTCLVADDFAAAWTLPKIEPLHISIVDEPVELPASTATKRLSEAIDADAPETKRPRYGLSEESSQVDLEDQSQRLKELERELKEKEDKLKEQEDKVKQLEEAHEHELAEANEKYTKAAEQIAEKEKHLENAQRRFENLVEKVRTIRKERDNLSEELRKANTRAERHQNELTKLRDERTQLRHDLDAARAELKASGGLAEELEQVRERVRQLEKDNSGLKRKADSAQQQAEYTREQYQNASTAAAQTGVELRQVRDENERLRRRVESDAVRLRELRARSDESRHLQRIAELESQLAAREDLLRRKEEELRSLRSARPSTRATSVQPRSPKLMPGGGPGSRSASPGIGPSGSNSNGSNNHSNNNSSVGRGSALRYSSEVAL